MNKWCVVFVCLVGLLAGAGSPAVLADPIQVYIMAGQSNMVGSGTSSELPTEPFNYKLPQQIPFSYDLESGDHVSNGFELLRPSVRSGTFGSELTFGRQMDEATTTPFSIIKVATSGTGLWLDWDPAGPEPGQAMYPRLINHVQSALAPLGVQGVDYQLAGLLWTQGESDTNDTAVALYHDNLVNFIQHVRTDLSAPGLPVYISRLSQFTNFKNRVLMRSAQSQVARDDPLVTVVDSDHLELRFDQIHYTTQGQLDLGHAYADAILYGPPPEDFDDDGIVTDNDLNILINHWNQSAPPGDTTFGDADGDGFVGYADLAIVANLIPLPPPPLENGDLTGEGYVGIDDLNILLVNWNQNVPQGDVSMGDLNVDGYVGITDLTRILAQWNTQVLDPDLFIPTLSEMDLDGSGGVDEGDIQFMFSQWSFLDDAAPILPIGTDPNPLASDFNADGFVDIEDLRYLLVEVSAGQAPPASVPEPALGLVLLAPLLVRGRRNRSGGCDNRVQRQASRALLTAAACLFILWPTAQAQATQTLINPGTRDWVAAATTGRADMLILGDSVVNHGLGWTGGIANAAKTRIGLAGSGLQASINSTGESIRYPGFGGAILHEALDWRQWGTTLPSAMHGYAISNNINWLRFDAPTTPTFWHAIGFNDDLLDRSAPYTWQLWGAMAGSTSGTIQGVRATRVQSPWSRGVLETSAPMTVDPYNGSLQLIELPFAPAPGEVSDWHELSLTNTSTGTVIFYNRAIIPNATGMTVTGWGYPGGTMNDFYTDMYNHPRRSQEGRAAYLRALIEGNSGKLNVVIAMGLNDSGENEASLTQGITPGYSPEAFIDNIQTQIDRVTADWAYAGLPAGDLSFTLPSTYQVGPELIGEERVPRLLEYRTALRELAQTDPRFSFIDMWGASPTAEEAADKNYIHDGEHPSREGSLLYGALFMNELLETTPIPGDLDGDGFVGINDLNLVLGYWNIEYDEPWVLIEGPNDYRPDPSYDGFVGIDDLNIVLANWNAGTPPPVSTVPQPATAVVLMVLGLGGVGARLRRV